MIGRPKSPAPDAARSVSPSEADGQERGLRQPSNAGKATPAGGDEGDFRQENSPLWNDIRRVLAGVRT